MAAAGHLMALVGPALVDTVRQQAPDLDLRFEQLDSARIVDAVASGVDLALGPAIDLGSRVLGKDPFGCLLRLDHPALDASVSSSRDLLGSAAR